ncbi:hypothetical protein CSV63_03080 [Sporosarcina sp. P34]|uniref:hypothetical protein n=1 Tax=Sporosarcina sp. P34 TaxID=2048247 RepID=UPI000C164AD7|nr:hypothetical protein [Sporosarcina sp. P34]PID16889.1 hypothetical protein CSV63_03080 [Sporosarcina sp. P34]
MFHFKVKYANLQQPGHEFWANVSLAEDYEDEDELGTALQQVIAKEAGIIMREIVVLQIAHR